MLGPPRWDSGRLGSVRFDSSRPDSSRLGFDGCPLYEAEEASRRAASISNIGIPAVKESQSRGARARPPSVSVPSEITWKRSGSESRRQPRRSKQEEKRCRTVGVCRWLSVGRGREGSRGDERVPAATERRERVVRAPGERRAPI